MEFVNKKTKDGKIVKLKNYKRRAMINKIKRRILLILLVLIVLIFILLYAPFMKIKKINCYGNKQVMAEDIISTSNICIGNNIFRINKNKATESIVNNPYINKVTITRKLPSTININVEECQVYAYVKTGNKYAYLNENCKVLEISENLPNQNIPVISGINITKCELNEIIEVKKTPQLENIINILSTLINSKFKGMVSAIDVSDVKSNKIVINNILEIILGDTENLEYKIDFMASGAYDSIGNNQAGTLDVSRGNNAVFKEKQ